MTLRILVIASGLLGLVGCASSPITAVDQSEKQLVEYPNIGEVVTKGLGESLVAKGVRTTGQAIEISKSTQFNKAEGESSIMTCAVTVEPGSIFKRGIYKTESTSADCYGPVNYRLTLSDGGTNWNCPGLMGVGDICRDSAGKYFLAVLAAKVELKQDLDHIREVNKVVDRQENFVQEMIYNGRVGDYLKFIYREFSDSFARPAFTQEVQYDISKSNVVGFKELRLEIGSASNTEITYKMLQSF